MVPELLPSVGVRIAMKNDPECRAALRLIRETIENNCPPGVLPSEEMVNGIYGPDLIHAAEASATAIVATVQRLSFRPGGEAAGAQHKGLNAKARRPEPAGNAKICITRLGQLGGGRTTTDAVGSAVMAESFCLRISTGFS